MNSFDTIPAVHDAFDRKEIQPSELVRHYLDRAKSDDLNAFITICEERALRQAVALDAVLKREGRVPREKVPLFGIPIGIKDNLVLDGVRTTCASKILENYRPPFSATCVERLEDSGAVILGKLNMDEFAMGSSNENSAFGRVLHPTHRDRVPGGSSGGAAAAVRAGLCFAALGSDTGGSIRLPASYCGVVGMKPTYGRVSRYGLVAFASSLDQVGPLARTVEDAEKIYSLISGHDPRDATSSARGCEPRSVGGGAGLAHLRIGVPDEYFVEGLNAEVESRIRESLRWFEQHGATLVPISLPHSQYAIAVYYLIAVSEASSNLARFDGVRYGVRPQKATETSDLATFYKEVRSNFGAEVKRRILLGTFALSSGYSEAYYRRACQVRALIQQDFLKAFSGVDLIAGPVAPTTAFRPGEKANPLQMYLNDIYTIPANLGGFPALSVPCGTDSCGLPIGLQLTAPHFSEESLFSAAAAFCARDTEGGANGG